MKKRVNEARTPDILGAIREIATENKQYLLVATNKTLNKENTMEQSKAPITFNLSLETLDILDDAWITLRRTLKGKQKITKRLLVEHAIKMVLKDLKDLNEKSELFKRLRND